MYKGILFLVLVVTSNAFLFAQTNDTGITTHKSGRIDLMMKKQFNGANAPTTAASTNAKSSIHAPTKYKVKREGYRVMVLNTNDRELAYKTKGQLLSRFPEHQVYMSYQTPFFKMKIGDFTNKSDAENLRKELAKIMSKGVFLIREKVIVTVNMVDEAKI